MRLQNLVRALALVAILAVAGCDAAQVSVSHTPTFADLRPSSVSLLSAGEGWAVGGVLPALRLHDGRWERAPLDDLANGLRKVVLLSPTDGWAVGGPNVFHYDGVRWTRAFTSGSTALEDVAFVSPTEGWAVGETGVVRFHDGQWADLSATLPPPDPAQPRGIDYPGLRGVSLVSPSEGWAVGEAGAIWHFDGAGWRRVASPPISRAKGLEYESALFAAAVSPAGDGWAVGGVIAAGVGACMVQQPAVVERLAGGRWKVAETLPGQLGGMSGQPTLRALALAAPGEAWAAGATVRQSPGTGEAPGIACAVHSYLLHEVGGQWTPVPVPDVGMINGLAFDAPDDGWAAADGGLLHYHAGTWTAVLA